MNRPRSPRIGLDPRAVIGLVALGVTAFVCVLAFTGALNSLFSGSTRTVRADFSSIEGIVPNDPVRIHGVQVGTVASTALDPGGRGATVTINLTYPGPIYANASASILWRTILGANDAIALDPGTRAAGPLSSGTIPRSHDSNQVELDQITRVFHGGAPAATRTLIGQFVPALSTHRALAQDLGTLAQIAPAATAGVGALRGQQPDTNLRNLVSDASRAARALSAGTGGATTRQFVQSAAATLGAIGADPAAVQATLGDAATVLPHLARTASNVNQTLYRVDALITNLTPKAPEIAPALAALHPAVSDARTLLSDATPLLHRLRPAVGSLVGTANAGVPVITSLSPGLQRLAKSILPALAKPGPEEGTHAPYELIGPLLLDLANIADWYDSDGHFASMTVGMNDPQSAGLPCTLDFSGKDFLVCNSLSSSLQTLFGGGTSLLQSLVARPRAGRLFTPLLSAARRNQAAMTAADHALAAKYPGLAKVLTGSGR